MNDDQLKALLKEYVRQARYTGACEVNLPQADFEAMREFIKNGNYTTIESNAVNMITAYIDGKAIKIGGY